MFSVTEDWVRQGLAHHQAGRIEEAKRFYEQALAVDGQHPHALNLAGLVALETGECDRAIERMRRACALQPKNWMFRANLASALLQSKDYEQARAAYRAAAKLNPNEPQLLVGAASCRALGGDPAGAEADLRKIVRRFPAASLAWFNLGNAVRDQGRTDEAAKLFRRAVELDPGCADAWNNLGGMLHALQQFGDAQTAYRQAISLKPGDSVAYCNLASVLIDQGRFTEAENVAHEALAIDPHSVTAHSMLAAALSSQGRLTEAVTAYRAAAALAPDDLRLRTALGSALFEAGDAEAGIEILEGVLTVQPGAPAAHQGLAWAYLASGKLDAGWREYYHRPVRARFVSKHPHITLALDLPGDLTGRTVCLLREQGLGDELFFLRYVAPLAARGATVVHRADPRLAEMLRRNRAFDRVLAGEDPLPQADAYVLVGDLPHALRTAEPGPLPPPLKLAPLPEKLKAFSARLEQLGPPPYIGLTWRAGIAPEQNRSADWTFFKQAPLAKLIAALGDAPGTVLVLQRNPSTEELHRLAQLGRAVHDLSDINGDLESMLALLALIDDYIGVSNTNMHLRAGVGRAARVLVPRPPEWRWAVDGDRSRWFPDFRLYRQQNDGDWGPALEALSEDLRAAPARDAQIR